MNGIRDRCLKLNDSRKDPTWSSLAVNRQKRVLMCLVFKAATTTWFRVLLRLTGDKRAIELANSHRYKVHDKAGLFLPRMHEIKASARNSYMTGDYYKVMFARDPLERLISAYRDKMFRNFGYNKTWHAIKRMFRGNILTRSLKFVLHFCEHYVYRYWRRDVVTSRARKLDWFRQNLQGDRVGKERSNPMNFSAISLQEPERKWPKTKVFVTNTTRRFDHSRFTDFHETWSKHVNLGDLELFCSEVLIFFHFPKTDFGTRCRQMRSASGINNSKTAGSRKKLATVCRGGSRNLR